MAWNDLLDNQMVSFTDLQLSGFSLNPGQSAVTSNQCMTKAEVLEKYSLNATNLSAYASNQLVPKGGLIGISIVDGLTIFGAIASSLSPIGATIWYFVSTGGFDSAQPYPLNKTWVQLGIQQTLPQCNSSILFGSIPMTPGQYAYIQIRNSTNTLLYQSQLGFKDTPSLNPCLVPQSGQYTGSFSYGEGSSGNTNLLIKLTSPITSIAPPTSTFNPTIAVTVGSYTYSRSAQGPTTVTGNSGSGTVTWSYVGTGSTTYAASSTPPTNAGTYTATASVAASGNYTAASSSATAFTIAQKVLTVSGATTSNKEYDRTNTAIITGGTLVGIISPDVVTLTQSGTFGQITVGTSVAITSTSTIGGAAASNYTLTQPSLTARNITPKVLMVTGLIGSNKVYDGNNTATVTGTAALIGVISGDIANVTLGGTPIYTFGNANVGSSKVITASGFSISGTASVNYSLTQPTGLTANITEVPPSYQCELQGTGFITDTGVSASVPSITLVNTTNPTNQAGNNGTATITFGGGVGPFTYTLNSVAQGAMTSPFTINGLSSTTSYTIQITDSNNNTTSTTFTLGVSSFFFDADYIMLTYEFTDGQDLDTKTLLSKIISPSSTISPVPGQNTTSDYLGYAQTIPPGGTSLIDSSVYNFPPAAETPILTWGSDNTGTGFESVLINVRQFKIDYPTATSFVIDCRCLWWIPEEIGVADVNVAATLWKNNPGGVPEPTGCLSNGNYYCWTNPSAILTGNIDSVSKQIFASSANLQERERGERLATLTYNLTTKRASFNNNDTTTNVV